MSYAKDLPIDKQNNAYQSPPAYKATATQKGIPIASSVITFNDNSTVLDVMALSGLNAAGAILGKWGSASVTTSSFDWMVASGQNRTFVIPVSIMGVSSIAGANVANGLYPNVAVICATAQSTSIFTAEY